MVAAGSLWQTRARYALTSSSRDLLPLLVDVHADVTRSLQRFFVLRSAMIGSALSSERETRTGTV